MILNMVTSVEDSVLRLSKMGFIMFMVSTSSIHRILIEHLLCARTCMGDWGSTHEQTAALWSCCGGGQRDRRRGQGLGCPLWDPLSGQQRLHFACTPGTLLFTSEFCSIRLKSGEGNGNPPQYSCLENPMDRGAWWSAVHGVTRSWTRLSNFTFTFHFHALEKEMATHSSVLAWRIPGTGEPGGLPSMGSHRVGYDWSDLAAATVAADLNLNYYDYL